MASKSKQSSKSIRGTQPKAMARHLIAALPKPAVVNNFMAPSSFVVRASALARMCVDNIVQGKGNFADWNKIMHRFYAGSIAYEDYFKADDGIGQTLNLAIASLHLIMVRTHCVGVDGFGMKPTEHQRILDGLALIDMLIRNMRPSEVEEVYHKAGWYLDQIVTENKKASDLFHERQQVLQNLAAEYQSIRGEVSHV
jgi:hypothetical protein